MSNVKKNLGMQTAYQIVNTCIPLLTAPYLARTLGAAQEGVYSYTTSVMMIFTTLAALGTYNHGVRSIAKAGDDRALRSTTFWEIWNLKALSTLIFMLIYGVYLFFLYRSGSEYCLISTLQYISLLTTMFGIGWMYFGREDITTTVIKSMIIRLLSVTLIFLLVKKQEDLWLYALIMLCGGLFADLILWLQMKKHVDFVKVSWKGILQHLKPSLILLIPVIALSVYHRMDKLMLGWFSTNEQSGYYAYADKLVNIPLVLLNGVGAVMLPRMTVLFSSGQKKAAESLFLTSLEGMAIASVAMCCGVAAISPEFVPFFFGDGFLPCIELAVVFAPILVIKSLSSTVRTQCLIPLKMDGKYTVAVFCGAGVNLVFNALLIPKYGALGATIGTLLAELTTCVVQFIMIRKVMKFGKTLLSCVVYLLFGLLMAVCVRFACYFAIRLGLLPCLLIGVASGVVVFCGLCVVYWKLTKNTIYQNYFMPVFAKFLKRKSVGKAQ